MSKEPAVASIIPEFHGATDDWNVYQEILEEFYRAHGIAGEARVPVLISVIGKDTYRTLRDLCHPRSPKQMSYDELCKVLARQFIPEIAIFRRRSKFYRAEQARGESVKEWYARLKALSVDCAFAEEQLEPLLLDRFVIGLAPGPVQDRLCEERPDSLTLERAVDLAAAKEATLVEDHEQNEVTEEFAGMALGEGGRHRRRHRLGAHHGYHRFDEHEHRHGHGRRHGRHRREGGPFSDREERFERHHHRHHHGPPPHRFGGEGHHGHHEHGPHHHFGAPAFGPGAYHGFRMAHQGGRVMPARPFGHRSPFGPGPFMGGHGPHGKQHGDLEKFGGFFRKHHWSKAERSCRKGRKHCRRRSSSSSSSSSSNSSSSSGSSSSDSSASSATSSDDEVVAEKHGKKCHKLRKGGAECKRYGKRHDGKYGKRHGGHHGRHHRHHHGEGSGKCRKQRLPGGEGVAVPENQPEEEQTGTDPTTPPELVE